MSTLDSIARVRSAIENCQDSLQELRQVADLLYEASRKLDNAIDDLDKNAQTDLLDDIESDVVSLQDDIDALQDKLAE